MLILQRSPGEGILCVENADRDNRAVLAYRELRWGRGGLRFLVTVDEFGGGPAGDGEVGRTLHVLRPDERREVRIGGGSFALVARPATGGRASLAFDDPGVFAFTRLELLRRAA